MKDDENFWLYTEHPFSYGIKGFYKSMYGAFLVGQVIGYSILIPLLIFIKSII